MSEFEFDDNGALAALAAIMSNTSKRAALRVGKITGHYGILLQGRVKANAAGRPGPRIQTGDYSRSISLRLGVSAGSAVAVVGTNRPQGRRLEFGFHGEDAKGRAYSQDPLPHFGPALDTIGPKYQAALAELAADLEAKA